MKKALTALMAAAVAALAIAKTYEVDGVAAVVGTATILKSDVKDEMARRGVPESEAASRYAEFRTQLVERELALRAAKASKLTLQEWVVDERVQSIIDDVFDGDRNKLVESLSQQKIPYGDWRRRIREDLVVGAMRWNVVDKNVRATPAAMRREYEEHPERYQSDKKVTVAVILLKPEDADKRDEVMKALKKSGFHDVAKKYSADSKAKDGGVWKDVKPSEAFRPEICAEIDRTPVGTISKWVPLDGWYFLLKKESESDSAPRSFKDAYDDIAANVKAAEAKRLYTEWMDRLKAETYIKIY